ncbi:hypothetical protein [Streptomyces kronopolitis]|uniref:hypothetical protein n=1 Tax=Streptomyces kronopolitis TaxID=1612435 RepID=UPI0020C02A25|nr:hypothetical protein [Streptomyces kronopolitis]MCL6299750.1 hypothetical protein [Streptomyces kronopolitis]
MNGTTSGRYDPYDSRGTHDASPPPTARTPITLRDPGTAPHPTGPMHHRTPHGNRLAPTGPPPPGAPYGSPDEHRRPGTPGAEGRHAGARGRPGETARGLCAARTAQGPGGDGPEDHRRGIPCGEGTNSGQESGNGDDIAVGTGAPDTAAPDTADTGDAADPSPCDSPYAEHGRRAYDHDEGHAYDSRGSRPYDGEHVHAYDRAAFGGSGPDGGAFGGGSGGSGEGPGSGHPTGGFGGEDDLRRLLQSRVGDLEPSPDALEQLRRAVPARRQRRRHAVVGAAAALLLGGTSIPAMVHVANLADSSGERPANTASSRHTQGGAEGVHGEGTEQAGPRPPGADDGPPGADRHGGRDRTAGKNGAGPGAGAGTPAPDETMDVTSPVCGREQLGQGTSTVGTADSAGRVYGAFRVVNTSSTACSVDGGGTVGVVAQGATNPDRIHVVDHTSGDEATGLPDPATTPDQLVLKPGESYEVKFAWIPQSGGGATGCANPGPSPTPEPTKDAGQSADTGSTAAGDGGGQAGGDTGSGDSGAAAGGIVLSHTPEAGEPAAADAKVADACAGTVYRTEALAAPR